MYNCTCLFCSSESKKAASANAPPNVPLFIFFLGIATAYSLTKACTNRDEFTHVLLKNY